MRLVVAVAPPCFQFAHRLRSCKRRFITQREGFRRMGTRNLIAAASLAMMVTVSSPSEARTP
ncbi:MAG: hypothetical protein E5X43_34145, partial [Mesorhizobium sp.]